ncbi:MAG: DNA translocase FtsK 4TM domain-containing protein [Candidatus Thiosymbion ectosymbiont of Robbea hypermnestra]|nr:DNA translocase FtsK 4TM domain-containing protein [Candidatus Thiosymbion ectosymbiont of Robbea hypermnestra]
MTQATRVGTLTFSDYLRYAIREGAMWALICVAFYLALALLSYSPQDPGWSHIGYGELVSNAGGRAGAWFADVAFFLFGVFSYLIPVMVGWSGYLVFHKSEPEPEVRLHKLALRWFGFFFTLAAGCAFASIYLRGFEAELPNGAGGGLGLLVSEHMILAFGDKGTALFLLGLFLAGFRLFTGVSWLTVLDALGEGVLILMRWGRYGAALLLRRYRRPPADAAEWREPALLGPPQSLEPLASPGLPEPSDPALVALEMPLEEPSGAGRDRRETAAPSPDRQRVEPSRLFDAEERPPLELLDPARKSGKGYTEQMLEELSRQVEAKLADFGVVAEVVEVHTGPVVVLLELQLAPGTKVSKITGLAKDIARALSTTSVRVVEVIPGKSVIGLEIPNAHRETVFLSEILSSSTYQAAKSPLTLAMGTDIAGQPVCADLARMPHALIAGTTGSGKSVAINVMILSLVYKSTPRDVRLIMVDPKMLELSVYEDIPHLLTPVVTDMKEAANALRWCVAEMEHRYRLMAQLGVRNIVGYNRKVADATAAGEPIPDPLFTAGRGGLEGDAAEAAPHLDHLPYIVVIIDELADMMMVVGKKVEELIARLAQKARASGIHLLLATQRPSVDVLTGLIKANIPTRMAFQVSSRIDSRTILDQMGAEHLLGWGDMLYLPPGTGLPQRVHGAFVDDQEVHRVAEHLKRTGPPDYIDTVLQDTGEAIPGIDPEPGAGDVEDQDPLFDEAVRIVTETRRASISGVQRRLKIGYNRAARMIEEMERIGLVGPAETNGNREVLVPPPPEA